MDTDRLERLQLHAEYGHLEGQDYDAVMDLVAEVRRLQARVAQLEGRDPLEVFQGRP